MKRMDRYTDDNTHLRRAEKNQELYKNFSNNYSYTNITDVRNANAFEIGTQEPSNGPTRESYHKMRQYKNVEQVPRVKKELDDFNYLYQKNENKVYDINSVLEEARKNRQEKDALEEKRYLKNKSYNILSDLNAEKLEQYREERKKKVTKNDAEEIRELIDTITSKTLAGEIDRATSVDLLSDLMATNILDKVEKPEDIPDEKKEEKEEEPETETEKDDKLSLSKEILTQEELKEAEKKLEKEQPEDSNLKGADKEFYTKSMDLSDKDFEMSDDFKEKSMPLPLKILIILLIISLIAIAIFFIYQRMS